MSGTQMTSVIHVANKKNMIPKWRFHANPLWGKTRKFTAFRAYKTGNKLVNSKESYVPGNE